MLINVHNINNKFLLFFSKFLNYHELATIEEFELSRLIRNIFYTLLKHLYSYKRIWDTCDIFVVEQQYVNLFGRQRGINIDALKLGEATVMWFLEHYPHKIVKTFGSQYKTTVLQAPKKMSKPQRKKWATLKALEIFRDREDKEAICMWDLVEKVKGKRIKGNEERIQSFLIEYENCTDDIRLMCDKIVRTKQKLDDISDVVVQLQAYKYKTFVSQY